MSNWDTIFGWALITISVWTMLAIGAAAAWSTSRRTHDRRTAADEYEASPYGPVRRFNTHRLCELRGHQYGINEDGTHWVCVRGDDRVPVNTDLDAIENYANGGAA